MILRLYTKSRNFKICIIKTEIFVLPVFTDLNIILSLCKSLCINDKCFCATAKPKQIWNNIDFHSKKFIPFYYFLLK